MRAALLLALAACAPAAPLRLGGPTAAQPTVLAAPTTLPDPITAADAHVDAAALARLDAAAARTHSDALVILVHGRVLFDRRYTPIGHEPIETMSITKSIAAVAVSVLVADGTLAYDDPLTRWFPEWKQGQKQRITLRHVLTHTSGLQDDDDTTEIWRSPDFVQLALTAELTTAPGAAFRYNNKAANLVGEVVRRASGERLDQLVARRLFAPLGIERYEWLKDPAGHALVQSGLKLGALDLARVGDALLAHDLHELTRPSAKNREHGLFFWLPRRGYAARGYLGQRLVVLPDRGVVVVRLRQWTPQAKGGADDFDDLEHEVDALFPPQ